ncbi:MAG TPA: hypothetical protein VG275_09770 [Solirubrobacteraceae bacterium]|nr:hypothetical protein [Solirubrobacteraceae bacterium]
MRRKRWAFILTSCVVSMAFPGQVLAASIAPPGKAGADQYFETLPSSGGNVAPPAGAGGNGSSSSGALARIGNGRAGASGLAHLGPEGTAAAALAAATAPTPAAHRGRGAGVAGASGALTQGGASTASALTHVLTGSDSGGLGIVLPLLLATSVIAALGLAGARLRRRGDPPQLGA